MSKVLIVSLEGIESNTEINFFKGLNDHIKTSLQPISIGKVADKSRSVEKLRWRIRIALGKSDFSKYKVFFIGDNDASEDIVSMERSKDVFIDFWKNDLGYEDKLIHKTIIYPGKGKAFEKLLIEIESNSEKLMKGNNQKATGNVLLFNNFAEIAKWFDGDKLNSKKIKEDLERVKTDYILIFDAILEP